MSNEDWKGIIGGVRKCSIRVGRSSFPKISYERMKIMKGEARRETTLKESYEELGEVTTGTVK